MRIEKRFLGKYNLKDIGEFEVYLGNYEHLMTEFRRAIIKDIKIVPINNGEKWIIYATEANRRVLGFCQFCPETAYIKGIAIAEGKKERGIGKILLYHTIKEIKRVSKRDITGYLASLSGCAVVLSCGAQLYPFVSHKRLTGSVYCTYLKGGEKNKYYVSGKKRIIVKIKEGTYIMKEPGYRERTVREEDCFIDITLDENAGKPDRFKFEMLNNTDAERIVQEGFEEKRKSLKDAEIFEKNARVKKQL